MYNRKNSGNALFYVFMAVGLLGALTYSFVKGSRENYAVQNAARVAEEMYVQVNLIKSSVMQCTMEYIEGGGQEYDEDSGTTINYSDLNDDGLVNTDDNSNVPYPLEPSDALIDNAKAGCTRTSDASGCVTATASNDVRYLSCVGAPIGAANMFSGSNNSGSFMPPAPSGFGEWQYYNNSDGVYVQITALSNNMTYQKTFDKLLDKFVTCQAEQDYDGCGDRCFTTWIKRNVECP